MRFRPWRFVVDSEEKLGGTCDVANSFTAHFRRRMCAFGMSVGRCGVHVSLVAKILGI